MKYRVANTIAFIVMVTVNTLANALPIHGKTTGELSDQYPNLFVPAGITFSIWGVIYLSLASVMVWQFLSSRLNVIESARWAIAANFVLNALWIISWHYEYVALSLIIMVLLLATLVVVNTELAKHKVSLLKFAFGMYLGWICLATIANTTTLLVSFSWAGFGISEEIWTIVLMLAGAFIGIIAMRRLGNPYLALALVWGFAGIILKRQADYAAIAATGYACIALTIAGALTLAVGRKETADA